jgi:hypothetical protein
MSLHTVKNLALHFKLSEEMIQRNGMDGKKCLLRFRDLEKLIIGIPLREVENEKLAADEHRKALSYYLKFINTIDLEIAAEEPSNPYQFQTNRFIDSQIEQRLGCGPDERPWKLQSLLDQARETLREL